MGICQHNGEGGGGVGVDGGHGEENVGVAVGQCRREIRELMNERGNEKEEEEKRGCIWGRIENGSRGMGES